MRKILDIVPQGHGSQKETKEKKEKKKRIKDLRPKRKKEKKEKKVKSSFFPFPGIIIILGFLVIIAVSIFVVLTLKSKLSLTLYYSQENVVITDEIKVDVNEKNADIENRVIPGVFFEIEKEKWEIFSSTGKTDSNQSSGGTIKVYNSHNPPRPVALVAQTRFLSSGAGKIFRAQEKIYLSAAKIIDGKVVPSSIEVEVKAQSPGEEYNVPPSTFSVPGLAGSPLYYTVWGESENGMKGGASNELLKITEADIRDAKTELSQILRNNAIIELKNQIGQGYILDNDAVLEESLDVSCFKDVGVIDSEFSCHGNIKVKGLVFHKDHLKYIAFGIMETQKPANKTLKQESLETSFSVKGTASGVGKMILSISSKASAYEDINQDLLFYEVYGKKAEQIRSIILEKFSQIEKVELRFWPFWIKRAPKDIERISIELSR